MFAKIIDEFIDIDGHNLRYWQVGPQDGETVLLIHGMGAASEVWGFLAADLAKAGYRAIAVDLPGFGKSICHEDLPVPEGYLKVLDIFLQALQINQVVIVGHSMGGIMAAGYANRYPEKVAKLVLISSAGFGKIIPLYKIVSTKLAEKLILPLVGNRRIGPWVFWVLYGVGFPKEVCEGQAAYWREHDVSRHFSRITEAFGDWKVFDQLPNIKCPVFVLWGTWDYIVPVWHSRNVMKLLPQAQLKIFKGGIHCLHTAMPGKVNWRVVEFLRQGELLFH